MRLLKLYMLAVPLLCVFDSAAEMLMETSFENVADGTPFTRDLWTQQGFQPASWDEGLATRTCVCRGSAADGMNALRVMYPKGEYGTAHTGCQVPLLFDQRNEAYMSYYLKFSDNFSWGTTSYGGKLPGLAGGASCSGGQMCDGTNGWSARFMWRGGGKLILYLYDMLKTDKYGEDHQLYFPDGAPVVAVPGQWIHIAERVKTNSSPDSQDGEVQVWVNGVEVLFLKGRQFTNNGEEVDKLYISTFHGGDSDEWCPTDTCFTFFDDICIGTDYNDVRFPDCRKPDLGPDQTLCNAQGSVVLGSFDSDCGYSLTWFDNKGKLAEGMSLMVDSPGVYMVLADSGRCSLTDTIVVSDKLVPKLGSDKHICHSSFVKLDCGIGNIDGLVFSWKKDGVALDGENGPAVFVKDAGMYTVSVASDWCASAESSVSVSSGLLPVDDVAVPDDGVALFEVMAPGNYIWTDANGNTLALGNPAAFIPPKSEDYIYVSDADAFEGNVGKRGLTENAWTRSNFDTEFMRFNVLRDLVIDSLSIYPTKELDATISITDDATNEVVFCQTYTNLRGGGEQRLPLGASLPKGSYHIDARGTTAPLYHSHSDADIKFPYTVDGLIELNGCNVEWINNKGWYLFFYNWHVSAGNHCAPTPVALNRMPTSAPVLLAGSKPFEVDRAGNTLFINGLDEGCSVSLFNADGRLVAKKKAYSDWVSFSTECLPKGVYFLRVGNRTEVVRQQKIAIR
ncbi:MAG: T9SS type A sorting domain-containing protein [Paludibacteraceae bacterium]|nr:T9SS type A sorting domain-containing protein [Paludibacteraceae bacterium]